jgi:hypothetical protein
MKSIIAVLVQDKKDLITKAKSELYKGFDLDGKNEKDRNEV